MPSGAKVSFGDSDIFAAAARVTGPEIPAAFPKKYQTDLHKTKTSASSTAEDVRKLLDWEKAQGLQMAPAKRAVFEEYAKGKFTFGMLLVEHPTVPDPATYKGSVVLQRGVIVLAKGSETLFLRPYLHSAKDATHAVNLTPQDAFRMTFASDSVWFPLETTRACVVEPSSYVVLDVLTEKPLSPRAVPAPFRLEKAGQLQYEGARYDVARLTATLKAGQKWPDLKFRP